ncbi:DUF2269 family protein [Streptosporangium subroseum]|uniref:DUF2269 family protein n=1 Tax=Streptosporangium subroseum TaxID=106412 RepID=UPI001C5296D3|nr:DUF2269 family protein [Streptosporangium subroseum]
MNRSDTAARETGTVRADGKPPRMPIRLRRSLVVLHVISSVGWLGLTIGNLVLAVTGLTTGSPDDQHAAYRVMGMLGDLLLIPISLTAFVTGVLLGLGTSWGLLRHRWVAVKLVLTLIAVVLTPLALLPGIHDAVTAVSDAAPGRLADTSGFGSDLVYAGCVSLSMYVTNVVLSVFKPWGRTGSGKRRLAGIGAAQG